MISPTLQAVYASYEARQETGFRKHLGASAIGNPCNRALWYTFRWATRRSHGGRLLRLFETGHMAEARFTANLRAVGVTVHEIDPDTGKQWQVRDESGHFGGSMDGEGFGFIEAPVAIHVIEYKTHSEDSFKDLVAQGVQKAKPLHYAQMQTYMHLRGRNRAFYMAVNKNTDELYAERVRYDIEEGLRLVAKAQRIIKSPSPPDGISKNPSWFECKLCDHHAVCHSRALPERHCRSCLHSTPVDGGKWTCAHHGGEIPDEFMEKGCNDHLFIPAFVNGSVVDADEGAGLVHYVLNDGTEWTDGILL